MHLYDTQQRFLRIHGYFVVKNPSLPSLLVYKVIIGNWNITFWTASKRADEWPMFLILMILDRHEKLKPVERKAALGD